MDDNQRWRASELTNEPDLENENEKNVSNHFLHCTIGCISGGIAPISISRSMALMTFDTADRIWIIRGFPIHWPYQRKLSSPDRFWIIRGFPVYWLS